jgi:hypothetical protein
MIDKPTPDPFAEVGRDVEHAPDWGNLPRLAVRTSPAKWALLTLYPYGVYV